MPEWHLIPPGTLEDLDTLLGLDKSDTSSSPQGTVKQVLLESLADALAEAASKELLLSADDETTQTPTGLGAAMPVKFGPAQFGGGDPVQIDAAGVITFNDAMTVDMIGTFAIARTSGSQVAKLWLWVEIDTGGGWTQDSVARECKIEDADSTTPKQFVMLSRAFNAGDKVRILLLRDSSGANNGELQASTSSHGLGVSPSASLRIYG